MRAAYHHERPPGEETRRFLELLRALVVREIKGRYRRSLLGPLWAIILPVAYMVLFVALRRMLGLAEGPMGDAIVIYCALVPWTFFSTAVSRCATSVYANGPLVKKMSVPREVFPAAAVAAAGVDFVLAGLVLVGMLAWTGTGVSISLVWLAVLVPLTALLGLGVGLGAAALGTFRQDIAFAMPFVMQFWLFATPILYALSDVPEAWRGLYVLNPSVGLIEGYRAVLLYHQAPDAALLARTGVGTVLAWAVAWPLFRHLGQYFADEL